MVSIGNIKGLIEILQAIYAFSIAETERLLKLCVLSLFFLPFQSDLL